MSDNGRADSGSVPLPLLRRYLTALGWVRPLSSRPSEPITPEYEQIRRQLIEARGQARRDFEKYIQSTPGSDDVEIVLPNDRSSSDYTLRIRSAVRTLSELEGRPIEQLIADIRAIGFDVVQSRIPDELVRDETVHLITAANYVAGMKELLARTATTEIDPGPFFLRVKKEGIDYADDCHFGHTFRGSFGFTIESPISPNEAPTLLDIQQTPPFSRRVMQRLARGINDVCEAVRRDDVAALVNDFKLGFSANALEQFADLVEKTAHTGMSFAFAFSPEWPLEVTLPDRQELTVGPAHIEVTRAAAKSLRAQPTRRDEEVFGRIIRLHTEADPTDLIDRSGDRDVVILWSNEDLGEIQVRTSLSPADYLVAIDAHRNGRPVRVAGTLEKRGRLWILSNPTGLSIPGG